MSDKKKSDDRQPQHQGPTAPEDADLSTWLHRFFARDERPERIELYQVSGRNKIERHGLIFHEDIKPGDKYDAERCNRLANEIIASAKNDCASVGRKCWYQIAVVDKHRRSLPLIRRLGPFTPEAMYLIDPDGNARRLDEGEEEDDPINGRTTAERWAATNFEQLRWEKQRVDTILGQLLQQKDSLLEFLATSNLQLMRQVMEMNQENVRLRDHDADRAYTREMAKLKVSFLRDAGRQVRNILPGLFGSSSPVGNSSNLVTQQDHGHSPERALIDNFFSDCEEQGITDALFGQWVEKDGRLAPDSDKPGIFSPAQFAVLVGVRDGKLPPSAIDMLMDWSTDQKRITHEQILAAQALKDKDGMPLLTDGILMAIMELVTLRQKAREASGAVQAS